MNGRRHLRVAVREIDTGEIVVHAAGDAGANYDTLCGVSTSDDLFEEVDAEPHGRIDCVQCWSVYQLARGLTASDFADRAKVE